MIIRSEATQYFEGQKSVEEAANQVQSRVSIYLAEQYGWRHEAAWGIASEKRCSSISLHTKRQLRFLILLTAFILN